MTLPATLTDQLVLHRARAAAYDGELDSAAELLDGLDATPAVLDLSARILAQRGDLDRADECWARVLESHPTDRDARAGRDTIARIRSGRSRSRAIGALAVALVVVAATIAGVGRLRTDGDQPTSSPARIDPTAVAMRRLQQESATLKAQRAERTAASARRAAALGQVAGALAMPGLRVERRSADVRVVFRSGLFRSGTDLTDDAEQLLAVVGRRLSGLPVATTVVGHVVAVPGGRTSGGSTVAYARAQVAAARLAAAAGLPFTAFTLTSADQSEGPFSEPARNRTVTLLLRPVER